MKRGAVILLSGGIDSTTCLARLQNMHLIDPEEIVALIFDYGQTLRRELDVAVDNAQKYGAQPKIVRVDLGWMAPECGLLKGNTEAVKGLPKGRGRGQIEDGGTPPSYVPFRNGIFLAYAVGFAEAHGINSIYLGANGLDSGNYWDDRLEFVEAMERAAREGTDPSFHPRICAPFATWPKAKIVDLGRKLGVDYDATWSCYLDGEAHCGECDSCRQREDALWAGGWYDGEQTVKTPDQLAYDRAHRDERGHN